MTEDNTTEAGALVGKLLADPKLLAGVLEGLHDGDTSRVLIALPWKLDEEIGIWHRHDLRTNDILMEVAWQRRGCYTAMNHSYWGRGVYGEFETQKEAMLHANNILRQRGYILTGPEIKR